MKPSANTEATLREEPNAEKEPVGFTPGKNVCLYSKQLKHVWQGGWKGDCWRGDRGFFIRHLKSGRRSLSIAKCGLCQRGLRGGDEFGRHRAATGRERASVCFLQIYPEKRLVDPAATPRRPKTRVLDCSEFPHPDVLVLPWLGGLDKTQYFLGGWVFIFKKSFKTTNCCNHELSETGGFFFLMIVVFF